jgi:hypothetical protein
MRNVATMVLPSTLAASTTPKDVADIALPVCVENAGTNQVCKVRALRIEDFEKLALRIAAIDRRIGCNHGVDSAGLGIPRRRL